MSAIKIKTQNVTPCTKDIRKHNSSDLSSEDIQKIAGIFAALQDKASMLKKIHNSLGVEGIKNIFDMENQALTIEEQQILKGKSSVLNKKIYCIVHGINQPITNSPILVKLCISRKNPSHLENFMQPFQYLGNIEIDPGFPV
jgi:hypothetical protein